MTLAHAGLAVAIAGMTASSAWKSEAVQNQKIGETVTVAGYAFTLTKVDRDPGPNYTADRATFTVSHDGKQFATMTPERRVYQIPPRPATDAAIRGTLLGDVYAVVGEGAGPGAWVTRLYFNPAGAVDVGGRRDDGAGRPGVADRSPPPYRRPGARPRGGNGQSGLSGEDDRCAA